MQMFKILFFILSGIRNYFCSQRDIFYSLIFLEVRNSQLFWKHFILLASKTLHTLESWDYFVTILQIFQELQT